MSVVGYVEATTPTQILGWAWSPASPDARLTIDAYLEDAVVATAIADRPRDDLARNGIGDGTYAFAVDLPDMVGDRLAALRIVARAPDGSLAPLTVPPAPDAVADRVDRLQRTMDAVIGSQRLLHRTFQAALPQNRPEIDIAATQKALAAQVEALDVAMARIDTHLAGLVAPPPPAHGAGARVAIALSLAALGVAAWGLVHSLPG